MLKFLCRISIMILCLLLSVSGCTRQEKVITNLTDDEDKKLTVYATIYPLYDFVQKIGGELVAVSQIIPPGSDAHHFEPSAKLLSDLARADIIVYNGANMEPWLPKLVESLGEEGVTFVNTSETISLLDLAQGEKEHFAEFHHHGVDPHVWLSPKNAGKQGKAICDALAEKDAVNAEYYVQNYDKLLEKLEKLDREYRETLQDSHRKKFIVAHDSFGYLAEEYGLTQIPIRGLTAEAEPSPKKLREIISLARSHDLKYVFYESLTDPKVSQVIAGELGIKMLELNPLGNLTEEQIIQGEDYFSVMRANLANLKIALNEE